MSMKVVRLLQWIGLFSILGMAAPWPAAGRPLATGHVPAVLKHLRATGDLPDQTPLNLAIGLPMRDGAAFQAWLREVYNPASTNYHRFLTPAEFAVRFGPTAEQYQAVADFARAHRLTVTRTHGNRLLLDVTGAAADIGKTFGVHLRKYRRPEGTGHSSPRTPSRPCRRNYLYLTSAA